MTTGFLIGYFIPRHTEHARSAGKSKTKSFQEQLVGLVRRESLEHNLRLFSNRPHVGGSEVSHQQALNIKNTWQEHGFDNVELSSYDVLLSYPQIDKPNKVEIVADGGQVLYRASVREKVYEPSENDSLVLPPFLAYCPAGHVSGELIYVNYGRLQDFIELKSLGVEMKGKIAIMRYGKAYRGSKVLNAYRFGAIGALIYSDPFTYAPHGTNASNTFPNAWWLPGDGVQRGTTLTGFPGDPLTPLLPSIAGAHKLKINRTLLKSLPQIPCQPLGYDDAAEFLKRMAGQTVPPSWRGSLPISYRLGPRFINSSLRVSMEINNQLSINTTYNVIATITGREEPDRVVLLGNHRDSWVFGAVDATSATAVTMETARGLGKLLKVGWRPRRTVMLCNWGAEEHGIIGSTEWAEENAKMLENKAVVYLNMDLAVNGNYSFFVSSSPLLFSLVKETMKEITDPHSTPDNHMTLYDVMAKRFPSPVHPNQPNMITLRSGSDFHTFFQFLGVPYADWGYWWSQSNSSFSYTGYPVYHSVHETFYWYKKFIDPRFELLRSVTQFTSLMLLKCSDSYLIPFSLSPYNAVIVNYFTSLKNNPNITNSGIQLQYLAAAVKTFSAAVTSFEDKLRKSSEVEDFSTLRILNDKLMGVERAFIYPYGMPGMPSARHLLFAPNLYNMASFGGVTFPAVGNAVYAGNWDQVEKQISIVTWSLLSAAKLLTA